MKSLDSPFIHLEGLFLFPPPFPPPSRRRPPATQVAQVQIDLCFSVRCLVELFTHPNCSTAGPTDLIPVPVKMPPCSSQSVSFCRFLLVSIPFPPRVRGGKTLRRRIKCRAGMRKRPTFFPFSVLTTHWLKSRSGPY